MPYYDNFWHKDAQENMRISDHSYWYFCKIENWEPAYQIWNGIWLKCGLAISKVSLIIRLTNGEFILIHVSKPEESILNTCYDMLFHNC